MRHPSLMLLAAALLLTLAAAVAAPARAAEPELHLEHAWARAMPPGVRTTAAYLTIRNAGSGPDRLVGVACEAARAAELHTTVSEGGMMRMRRVTGGLDIPAGGSVALEPGGYHLMLIDLEQRLNEGDEVVLVLVFERTGRVALTVTARREPPGGG